VANEQEIVAISVWAVHYEAMMIAESIAAVGARRLAIATMVQAMALE